jgi:hypothetical protein
MAIVSDAKLKALASFIANNEVNGKCACCLAIDQMPEEMQKEVNAPCKNSNYEDEWCYDCPFWSKDGFLHWIKESNSIYDAEGLKKPKKEEFTKHVNCGDALFDRDSYINALEEYCDNLEDVLADTEYDTECIECEMRMLDDKLSKIRGVLDGKY